MLFFCFFCGCFIYLFIFESGSDRHQCRSPFIPPTPHRPPPLPTRFSFLSSAGFTAVHRFSISSRLFRQDVHPSVLSVRRLFFNAPSSTKWKMIAIEAPTLPFHLLIFWWISKIPADDWSKTSELISPERTFCLWWLGSLSLKCYVIHTVARSGSSASL